MTAFVISAFVTMLVVIDPIGLGPIFIGLTQGIDPAMRRRIALQGCLIAFCVLAGSAVIGDWLLDVLGISLAAFRIAGGLLLFAIAFEMVFGHRIERKTGIAGSAQDALGIAAFPLGIPLMAGPGAITAMILLASRQDGNMLGLALLIAIMGIMMAATLVVFLASDRLGRLIGIQGQTVFGRLLGVLLAALAVQYVADGVLALSR